ncbi:MAG: UDP-N-acetylmuramyl-tripeptide synthetase [Patescibacteria group bacterium]
MKKLLKKILPEDALLFYHYLLARVAALLYGFPSRKMIVIGVTGTKGKTSTINFIWACLMAGGYKTGIITTANIRIGEKEILNSYHMTMPGRFTIQKLMAHMVREGCTHCIVETSSEGLKQYRHAGIAYDIAVFTNLFPEHLQSHGGSFENYKMAKGKLFAALTGSPKKIAGREIEKVIVVNKDSEWSDYFLGFPADKKIEFGTTDKADVIAQNIQETKEGVTFSVGNIPFALSILGKFNVHNALAGITISRHFGVSDHAIARGLLDLKTIPGRMECITEGQPFTVLVDYAHERQSITNLLATVQAMRNPQAKIIILTGSEGGGRDKTKRAAIGELVGTLADFVVVSNADPYNDDPMEIIEGIATVAEKFGKKRGVNLFPIEDRRLGIRKALSLARDGDIVIIAGKGAEQSMIMQNNVEVPWDDRRVTREELKKLTQNSSV